MIQYRYGEGLYACGLLHADGLGTFALQFRKTNHLGLPMIGEVPLPNPFSFQLVHLGEKARPVKSLTSLPFQTNTVYAPVYRYGLDYAGDARGIKFILCNPGMRVMGIMGVAAVWDAPGGARIAGLYQQQVPAPIRVWRGPKGGLVTTPIKDGVPPVKQVRFFCGKQENQTVDHRDSMSHGPGDGLWRLHSFSGKLGVFKFVHYRLLPAGKTIRADTFELPAPGCGGRAFDFVFSHDHRRLAVASAGTADSSRRGSLIYLYDVRPDGGFYDPPAFRLMTTFDFPAEYLDFGPDGLTLLALGQESGCVRDVNVLTVIDME